MNTLREALINNDFNPNEIEEVISDMIVSVNAGQDPEEVLYEYGLEPDYVMELLDECM